MLVDPPVFVVFNGQAQLAPRHDRLGQRDALPRISRERVERHGLVEHGREVLVRVEAVVDGRAGQALVIEVDVALEGSAAGVAVMGMEKILSYRL